MLIFVIAVLWPLPVSCHACSRELHAELLLGQQRESQTHRYLATYYKAPLKTFGVLVCEWMPCLMRNVYKQGNEGSLDIIKDQCSMMKVGFICGVGVKVG